MKIFAAAALIALSSVTVFAADSAATRQNVIIFVADGLRAGSVDASNAPEMFSLETQGVRFPNSHSLFPTVTTANASAIATGHYLGDTGDFANTLYLATPIPIPNSHFTTPFYFLEDDLLLRNLDKNPAFAGNYLGEQSLLALARANGYQTAAIGKLGPAVIQDITQNNSEQSGAPKTIIIDDRAATASGVPLNAIAAEILEESKQSAEPVPHTQIPNVPQQQFFATAMTNVLHRFATASAPFVVVFWSRDPDGTQHNQLDSYNNISLGINGPTPKKAIRNCDSNLWEIRTALTNEGLDHVTDIFVTADHGFDTISKHEISPTAVASSAATTFTYLDKSGKQDVNTNWLPSGFLAVDLALHLKLPLYDLDMPDPASGSFQRVLDGANPPENKILRRPSHGSGLIGGPGAIPADAQKIDATLAVMANGGCDLIYLFSDQVFTRPNTKLATDIVDYLATQDYVSGIFIDDKYCANGQFPGALPMSAINLVGSSKMPRPSIIVNFASFTTDPANPFQHGVLVADTDLQEGQGNHGGFDRAATFNFMAVIGPDFKTGYSDPCPVSNADIASTFISLLHFNSEPRGTLTGRVLTETLSGQTPEPPFISRIANSLPAANGATTVLDYQECDGRRYFDAGGFPGRTLGLHP